MIESMGCGTPVIAFNCGSVAGVIEDSVTGSVVNDEARAIAAIPHLGRLSRKAIRQQFEERFTAQRMKMDYLSLYHHMAVKVRPSLRVVT